MSRMLTLLAVAVLVVAGWTSFSGLPLAVPVPLSLRANGAAQRIGNGTVRTYVLFDPANRRVPIEVGIALSADALEGLPSPMSLKNSDAMSGHFDTHERLLALPEANATPYKFIQFNWNPGGHEPPGIYDRPHFDFHFWTVPVDVRNAIVPSDAQYAARAASYPGAAYRTPFYVDAATAAKAPAAAVSVPQMGMHWLDVRSDEFSGNGFSKTYIVGSWDGQFVFDEPMITRDYIVAKRAATDPAQRDELITIPTPEHRAIAGYYPQAYRISYDAETNEYRIALTRLTWEN